MDGGTDGWRTHEALSLLFACMQVEAASLGLLPAHLDLTCSLTHEACSPLSLSLLPACMQVEAASLGLLPAHLDLVELGRAHLDYQAAELKSK
jgi:hypothetical protein